MKILAFLLSMICLSSYAELAVFKRFFSETKTDDHTTAHATATGYVVIDGRNSTNAVSEIAAFPDSKTFLVANDSEWLVSRTASKTHEFTIISHATNYFDSDGLPHTEIIFCKGANTQNVSVVGSDPLRVPLAFSATVKLVFPGSNGGMAFIDASGSFTLDTAFTHTCNLQSLSAADTISLLKSNLVERGYGPRSKVGVG